MNKRIRCIRRISREENHTEKREAFTTKREDRVEKEKKKYFFLASAKEWFGRGK
jgi:hypothetical protein